MYEKFFSILFQASKGVSVCVFVCVCVTEDKLSSCMLFLIFVYSCMQMFDAFIT